MSWSPMQEKSLLTASHAARGGWMGLQLHQEFAGLAFHEGICRIRLTSAGKAGARVELVRR